MSSTCTDKIQVLVSHGGAGRHVEVVIKNNPATLATRAKLLYSLSWLSGLPNFFSRTSILALYLRVFTKGFTWFLSWVLLFYLIAFVITQIIVTAAECRPISSLWQETAPGTKCINLFLWYKCSTVLNIVADVAIMIVPMHTIWTLQTSLATKAGIAVVFLSGSL